jgi:7-cyano-7-deazaguanine synthase in queuosine biosynthesis
MNKLKKILLLSGGFDSLLLSYQTRFVITDYIYLQYGQKFLSQELYVIDKWSQLTKKVVQCCNIQKLKQIDGMFFGRNLQFMLFLREKYLNQNIIVYFGNNATDTYSDNSFEYMMRLEKIINDSYPGMVIRIICPLANLTKDQIVIDYYNTPLSTHIQPYYCDSGKSEPCGKCHSCAVMKDILKRGVKS